VAVVAISVYICEAEEETGVDADATRIAGNELMLIRHRVERAGV
jgi:hypothetical protein